MDQTGSTTQSMVITGQTMAVDVKAVKGIDRKDVSLANAIIPFHQLTDVQKRFVVAYAGGATQADAYLFANPSASKEYAKKKAYLLLKNDKIAACVAELISFKKKKYDFSRDAMSNRLMLLFGDIKSGPINSKDRAILLDIYKEINRMYGNYDHHENQITVNNNPLQIIIEQEKGVIDIPHKDVEINPSINLEIEDGDQE